MTTPRETLKVQLSRLASVVDLLSIARRTDVIDQASTLVTKAVIDLEQLWRSLELRPSPQLGCGVRVPVATYGDVGVVCNDGTVWELLKTPAFDGRDLVDANPAWRQVPAIIPGTAAALEDERHASPAAAGERSAVSDVAEDR